MLLCLSALTFVITAFEPEIRCRCRHRCTIAVQNCPHFTRTLHAKLL
ncbi:maker78 [Drosophila busckii]|uniref:Maker78 n=1 Tax=Drosophila busckii TaxID=30019 RepID=A0A0M4ECZ2_DROBS|nr:maker78 [Drosophila busckii]